MLHSNLDHVERRAAGLTGGSLFLLCKDLRRLQLDIVGSDTFGKVADTLEDLSRVGGYRFKASSVVKLRICTYTEKL